MKREMDGGRWLVRITTALLGILVLIWAARISAQQPEVAPAGRPGTGVAEDSVLQESMARPATARLTGTILDVDGAVIPGAAVMLTQSGSAAVVKATSREDGRFTLPSVAPGAYQVKVERSGFRSWSGDASLGNGQQVEFAQITLQLAQEETVEVSASTRDVAEAQLGLEEKQRVLGVFPNFYASYAPDAAPLDARQKFQLARRFAGDPVAFAMAGVVAGSEQRANAFPAYGRGATGYMKRYGAAYTDGLTSTMLGQALLPVIFHQDPRFFVKENGSRGSRVLYAVASMLICKGDNGHWQPNYSNVLGNLASAGISNLYYPAASRGGTLVVQNAFTATALGAVGGMFQEFLLHRMTPNVPDYASTR